MPSLAKEKKPRYSLNEKGEFIIEDYTFSKPFANFFPGIAGKYGIPMWVFYVNRGQGIISCGTKDKDHAVLEFFPANQAWQQATLRGFRTFLKVTRNKKFSYYEPFHNGVINSGFSLSNSMRISSYDLNIEEVNATLGLKTSVEYFTIPNDSYAALVRILTIKNTSRSAVRLQLLDGVPQVVPFGMANFFLKKLSRTIEAWMQVKNVERSAAFFKLAVDPADRPEVIHIKEGNFYLSFCYDKDSLKLNKPLVDPASVFGPVSDYSSPFEFLKAADFSYPKKEVTESKTPCAFSLVNKALKANGELVVYTLLGYMRSQDALNSSIPRITRKSYLEAKRSENKQVIEELQDDMDTKSSSPALDFYCRQNYLDNVMRGGYPVVFRTEDEKSVFYLYSRKHGDPERDYNKFLLEPTYFSQGNGNYRDINQNRRCDNWFTPEIGDENLVYFFDLLQSDGFNPLVVKGLNFRLKDKEGLKKALLGLLPENEIDSLLQHLEKPYTPGQVIMHLEAKKIKPDCSYDEFLRLLLSRSSKIHEAEHGEGFWTDHWTYNLDLLENYLAIFPEALKSTLFEKRIFTFYDNIETVKPRHEKYLLYDGKPRQLHAVGSDPAKREMFRQKKHDAHLVRTEYGVGEIYRTTLINKLSCVLVNKLASLDPEGVGIEMESNKPNWYDALNGLPGLFGSSLCETLELKRLILVIRSSLQNTGVSKILLSEEVHGFLTALERLLKNNNLSSFEYWDRSYSLKEAYRDKTKLGFSGKEVELTGEQLNSFLDAALKKLEAGIAKAKDAKKELYASYFINEVAEYEKLDGGFIRPTRFAQKKLPLFLEGQMHSLRLAESKEEAKAIYQATRASGLFDKELKMYKVTESLKPMPEEIGRCRVFSPGWLEHESIWLHMEYKYLLEALRKGLYEEFYADFRNVLIPFQPPQRYGRNILENSSFLVSSAFVDKNEHGNGYVARLSGSTAEFIQIWLNMNVGLSPFILDKNGKLNLQFKPVLAGWLFTKKEGLYSFNFLRKCRLTYHNPGKKDTFGSKGANIYRIAFADASGKNVEINSPSIPSPYAEQVRSGKISKIDIHLK